VTTAQANQLLIAGVVHVADATVNVDDNWSSSFAEKFDLNGNGVLVASSVRIVSSTGTYSTGSTLQGGGGSGRTRCQTATFKGS
jgi:hypothetical protein